MMSYKTKYLIQKMRLLSMPYICSHVRVPVRKRCIGLILVTMIMMKKRLNHQISRF